MFSNRLKVLVATASCFMMTASSPSVMAQSSDAKTVALPSFNLEEMRANRSQLRTDLMVPSLAGIRGVVYGLPGHHPVKEMEQVVENGLKQLPVPVTKFQDLKSGETKPVDAFLQLKVLGTGNRFSLVELTVTQWCQLSRDPSINVKTITYTDQCITSNATVKDTAEKMLNQFVIDYLKANSGSIKKEASGSDDDESSKASRKKKKSSKKDG